MTSSSSLLSLLLAFSAPAPLEANILLPLGTTDPSLGGLIVANATAQTQFLPPINLPNEVLYARPVPTNVWWGNLIALDENQKSHPVYANPYKLELELDASPYGLHICYSHDYLAKGPVNDNGAVKFYIHGLGVQDMVLSATEFTVAPSTKVLDWDDAGFGVTTEMRVPTGFIRSSLVTGMPFITGEYTTLTPSLTSSHVVLAMNGQSLSGPVTDTKFVLALNNGQTWVVYASPALTLVPEGGALVASKAYTGTLRTALLRSCDSEALYDRYASCVVTGGQLRASDSRSYSIEWRTTGDCTDGLLHFSLEHQRKSLDTSLLTRVALNRQTPTHGTVRAYATTALPPLWHFHEAVDTSIGFYPPRPADASLLVKYNVLATLRQDIATPFRLPKLGSFYFTGKLAQKYGSLCLMAADPNVVGPNDDGSLLRTCLDQLEAAYEPYLTNDWAHPLIYDTLFHGLVSSESFTANDKWRDFGNSLYNDHHFHWGYWIAASAMLKHLDPTWSRMAELETMVNIMVRDVANPSPQDPFFPMFRNFDWFAGHSYSHGISPFADGKDQESTSEEMNFHYSLLLWGKATQNANLEALGQLMLKVNKRSINTYFLMADDNQVHPADFIPNKVTGIFFDNKVDYATWFCGERECIHGIQMIPVSPMNEFYRTSTFVTEEWEQVLSKLPLVTDPTASSPWQSLLFANAATVDREMAMKKLATVPMDDGLTRAWALYYAATRPESSGNLSPTRAPGCKLSTPSPALSPSPPTTTTPAPSSWTTTDCQVSSGNAKVGISGEVDSQCPNATGCYGNALCKHCRVGATTEQNAHLDVCSDSIEPPSTSTTPVPTPSVTAITTPAPTPSVTVITSIPTDPICQVSSGDANVGISGEVDSKCPNATGCYGNALCKHCRVGATIEQNAHLDECSDSNAPPSTVPCSTPTPSVTAITTLAPTPSVTVITSIPTDPICQVSSGDANVGISAMVDSKCPNGIGCYGNALCKFCRVGATTEQNAHLDECRRSEETSDYNDYASSSYHSKNRKLMDEKNLLSQKLPALPKMVKMM